jgi:RsiW-degrading membrane proteinase PrsW (M82 family)
MFSITTFLIGSVMQMAHIQQALFILALGLLSWLVFLLFALYEIVNSDKIDGVMKFLWVLGFFLLGIFTGLLYVLSERKKLFIMDSK